MMMVITIMVFVALACYRKPAVAVVMEVPEAVRVPSVPKMEVSAWLVQTT